MATGVVCLVLGAGLAAGEEDAERNDVSSRATAPEPSPTLEEPTTEPPAAEPGATPGEEPEPSESDVVEEATDEPTEEPTDVEPEGPATSFGPGMYLVGEDIEPGEYTTEGPDPDDVVPLCYWARLSDSSGDFEAIIANGTPEGPGRVTVGEGEYFDTSGCEWELA